MDDARRVGLDDGVERLDHVGDGLADGQRAARRDLVAEIVAGQQLHHHEGHAALVGAHVEDPDHVIGLELRGGPRLAEEALHQLGLLRGLRQEELDRDPLPERLVLRLDDHPHAAGREHPIDAVLARDHRPGVRCPLNPHRRQSLAEPARGSDPDATEGGGGPGSAPASPRCRHPPRRARGRGKRHDRAPSTSSAAPPGPR